MVSKLQDEEWTWGGGQGQLERCQWVDWRKAMTRGEEEWKPWWSPQIAAHSSFTVTEPAALHFHHLGTSDSDTCRGSHRALIGQARACFEGRSSATLQGIFRDNEAR